MKNTKRLTTCIIMLYLCSCTVQKHPEPEKVYSSPAYQQAVYEWGKHIDNPAIVAIVAPIHATINSIGRLFVRGETVQFLRFKDTKLAISGARNPKKLLMSIIILQMNHLNH